MNRSSRPPELAGNAAEASSTLSIAEEVHDKNFPYFRRPQVVGSFSLDKGRRFHHDRRQMKFYRPRTETRIRLNLNEGMERVKRKNEEECKSERLNHLLQWILLNRRQFRLKDKETLETLNTDFVCFRGCLSMLMCAPYETKSGWTVSAVRWRDTIYLHKEETEDQKRQRLRATDRDKTMCSWGYKFEQFVSSSDPDGVPVTADPVVESEEFCCVFRARLAQHSIVFGAEMDGLRSSSAAANAFSEDPSLAKLDLNAETFVELKTSRRIDHAGHERSLRRFKLLKWWSQSFLVAVPVVTCGFRDDDGIVGEVRDYEVREMPECGKEFWLANVCMNFLSAFLDLAKRVMREKPEMTVFSFEYVPARRQVVCMTTVQQGAMLLPDWFTSKVFA